MTRVLLIVMLISLCSCKTAPSLEITVLESIILRDFRGIPTVQKLLPITLSKDNYIFLEKARHDKPPILPDPKALEAPTQPPNPLEANSLEFNKVLFSSLTKNDQITKGEYLKLERKIKETEGEVEELLNPKLELVNKSAAELIHESQYDSFQEFSYPIIVGDLLVLYRNSYSGLLQAYTLGLTGHGTYYVYKKSDEDWILVNRITHWIS